MDEQPGGRSRSRIALPTRHHAMLHDAARKVALAAVFLISTCTGVVQSGQLPSDQFSSDQVSDAGFPPDRIDTTQATQTLPAKVHSAIQAEPLWRLAEQSLRESRLSLRRHATFSARQYALDALQLSVDAQDIRGGRNQHTSDLREAHSAIRESMDFESVARTVPWSAMQRMVVAHETTVLKSENLRRWSCLRATEAYLRHAQNKLVAAASGSPLAARAMVLLGQVEKQIASDQKVHSRAVAMTYHAAATRVMPKSFEVHREYGRTLLQQGLANQAAMALRRSIAIRPSRLAYQTLLEASRRTGDFGLVSQCHHALQDPHLFNDTMVVRLSPSQFASTYRPTQNSINQVAGPSESIAQAQATDHRQQPRPETKSPGQRFRSLFPFAR